MLPEGSFRPVFGGSVFSEITARPKMHQGVVQAFAWISFSQRGKDRINRVVAVQHRSEGRINGIRQPVVLAFAQKEEPIILVNDGLKTGFETRIFGCLRIHEKTERSAAGDRTLVLLVEVRVRYSGRPVR